MVEVFPDHDHLCRAAADYLVAWAVDAVKQRGWFLLALSGGKTPRPLYRLLADGEYRDRLPWKQTTALWSDERFVPLDDERSNAGVARDLLLDHVPIPADQVITMYMQDKTPEEAAAHYSEVLGALSQNDPPRLDVALLGCGNDGHTASLFPGSTVLDDRTELVRAVRPPQSEIARVTMMPRLLNQARRVLFLVQGEQKAGIVRKVLEGPLQPSQLPAQLISPRHGRVYWLLDRAAASSLAAGANTH